MRSIVIKTSLAAFLLIRAVYSENQTDDQAKLAQKPKLWHTICAGLLAVTITNLAALVGIIFKALEKSPYYTNILSFMVASAMSTLAASALLVLMPEALNLSGWVREDEPLWNIPLCSAMFCGIVIFYCLETLLHEFSHINGWCKRKRNLTKSHAPASNANSKPHQHSTDIPPTIAIEHHKTYVDRQTSPFICGDRERIGVVQNGVESTNGLLYDVDLRNEHQPTKQNSELCDTLSEIDKRERLTDTGAMDMTTTLIPKKRWYQLPSIVWIIILGDAFHNFMDGVSIAVAFMRTFSTGITVTLSVLCEELPHEMGDIAVMLQSGMSIKQALLCNFLSACSAYIGLAFGLLVGDLDKASFYIFAITSGFFLYISLTGMLPEMRTIQSNSKNTCTIFLCNIAGIVVGFVCILLITVYAGDIKI